MVAALQTQADNTSAEAEAVATDRAIARDAEMLSAQLQAMRDRLFSPTSKKALRSFSSGEAARLIGVSDGYLRQLSIAGEGPQPETGAGGRRYYSLDDINALRRHLAEQNPAKARHYLPRRDEARGEHLQVIAVTNFKGGSGKTTTSAHLAQHLALAGYRVLAIDLDPQASLSALFGYQPELDLDGNDTLYGAIRYDDEAPAARRDHPQDLFRRARPDPGQSRTAGVRAHDAADAGGAPGAATARPMFFARVQAALQTVADDYDVVVIDCPPQLGFLTLSALCAATSVLVTIHPQMLDVASMSQFLFMTADLLSVVREAGGELNFDFMRYLSPATSPMTGRRRRSSASCARCSATGC